MGHVTRSRSFLGWFVIHGLALPKVNIPTVNWRIGRNITYPLAPLCENMTSSTKAEVHNNYSVVVGEGPIHDRS